MPFPWSHAARRRELLAQPFSEAWRRLLWANVRLYRRLPPEQQQKLEDGTRILIAEKSWEGVQGLALTDEIRVTIAGMASLLALGFDHDYYPNVETIIVYPQGFLVTEQRPETLGVYAESVRPLIGQAALQGPVIVSWADVQAGIAGTNSAGGNVVLHEFAHKIDMRDGAADGAPYLENAVQIERWSQVMSAEYQDLVAQTQAGEIGLLNPYGATNAAEFFAVATETFFESAPALSQSRPELYAVLRDFYHQDPAALLA